jgi:hypothetical protein
VQATDGRLYGSASYDVGSQIFAMTLEGTLTSIGAYGGPGDPQAIMQDTGGLFYGPAYSPEYGYIGSLWSLSVGLGPFVETQTSSGKVGSMVEILGSSLAGTSSVTFNGVEATFTVNSTGTAISATVPAGATTGTVQVVTPGGTLSSNVSFRVLQ